MAISIGTGAFRPRVQSSSAGISSGELTNTTQQRLDGLALRRIAGKTNVLSEALVSLREILNSVNIGTAPKAATVISSTHVSLSSTATYASLQSSGEVVADDTSYSPASPDWQQGSQASPLLSGIYNGAQGTGTLLFSVTQSGIRGLTDARIELSDPGGGFVEEILIAASDPVDTQYSLSNGLLLTLDGGTILPGDEFTVLVEENLDLQLNPAAAFDGSSGSVPGFDDGEAVGAGTFQINGVAISVLDNDSVNSILSKINASTAGVTASYDTGSEIVTLLQNTPGSAANVDISADTSGLIAALKLDDGEFVAGTDSDLDIPLSAVSDFAGVTNGNVIVNGQSIAIDRSTDSVADIVGRINQSGSGAFAVLVPDQRLVVRNFNAKTSLSIDDNGTGFFAAFNIDSDTVEPSKGADRPRSGDVGKINAAVEALIKTYNDLFTEQNLSANVAGLSELRAEAESAFTDAIAATGLSEAEFGIKLRSRADNSSLEFSGGDANRFRRDVRTDFKVIRAVFTSSGETDEPRFIDRLLSSVNSLLKSIAVSSGKGSFVDTTA